jgi:hypothetical protein
VINAYVFVAFVPAQTCGLGRARTASAKAEAHFSIWGHTVALCVATLFNLQPSAVHGCRLLFQPKPAVWAARALAKLKLGRISPTLGNYWRYAVPR